MKITHWVLTLAICATAAGCTLLRGTPDADVKIVAVGDSVLAWNRSSGQDIPTLVGQATGLPVFNAAISGAKFIGRFEIPRQFPEGQWDWVIVDGGGNDLNDDCGDPVATEVILDSLIDDADLSGAYADFITPVAASGSGVIIMGYMPISVAGGPFAPCEAALDTLRERQMALADSLAMVTFVDTRDVIARDNLDVYDADLVHPSPSGGALMAAQIAGVINGDIAAYR